VRNEVHFCSSYSCHNILSATVLSHGAVQGDGVFTGLQIILLFAIFLIATSLCVRSESHSGEILVSIV
jgi:hypothetical protein